MRRADVRRAVFRWAGTLDRPLPWRGERDPYRILVSEVMLQQTQALRVAPIYERFLDRFPNVEALAVADAADVLRAWENLGYNRRALNLWRAARDVVVRGGFPRTVPDLAQLPGVGAYTARAIASFAFGVDVAAVDANVRRVVARLHGATGERHVQALADALVPRGNAAEWNQAMIDLGAEVCRARSPRCGVCPLNRFCHTRGSEAPPTRATSTPFHQTSRYARGRVVAALRAEPSLTLAQLKSRTALPMNRLRPAVEALARDGLVRSVNDAIWLGT